MNPTRREIIGGLALTLAGCAASTPAPSDRSWPTPWGTLLSPESHVGTPGWMVEIDPASGMRTRRPALGWTSPAGAATWLTSDGRAVVLISDQDERLWRFVGESDVARLSVGSLTAARLSADGALAWVEDTDAAIPIRARPKHRHQVDAAHGRRAARLGQRALGLARGGGRRREGWCPAVKRRPLEPGA